MKDPLEYTKEELQELPTEVLEQLLATAEYKESFYHTSQLVQKTMINSLYGALANKYFPLFNESMAAAITGNGRFFIQKTANMVEGALQKLNPSQKSYIVYGDTDSFYYQIAPFMERYMAKNPGLSMNEYVDFADNFEKKVIQPIIQKSIDEFAYALNAYNKDKIGCEREIISDRGVFVAKKKYFARVRDSEGTRFPDDAPYIKKMGLEVIKSSTPTWCKKYLQEAIPKILDSSENDLRNWIKEIKHEFTEVDLNEIAAVGGVSSLDYKLSDSSVPIGSRAAIVHNNYVQEHDLTNKFAPIQGGDKCKRLYLVEPNQFNSNIVAFTNELFVDEINKTQCVDYDTQFEKTFMSPLNIMVKPLNYNLKKETEALDDW